MHSITLCLAGLMLATPAFAEDPDADAPEFLLGDVGVRIDLNKRSWKMTRWSDWDFKAESKDGSVKVFAWATEVQTPLGKDAEAWAPLHVTKMEDLGDLKPKFDKGKLHKSSSGESMLVDFKVLDGDGVYYGATLPIEGKMFHLAFVSNKRFKKQAKAGRDDVLGRLDVKKGPADVEWGPELEANGIKTKLPEGWREPLDSEMKLVMKQIQSLGVENLDICWLGMRPVPAASPDVMLTCQGGVLLGVVDSYSFEAVEQDVRKKMFGSADMPAAAMVELEDRVGFKYTPELSTSGLAVGVVPYDQGVSRTWVVGGAGDETLGAAVDSVMAASSFSGPHPASVGDQISYWISYRPFSPVVLCPALGFLGFFGIVLGVGAKFAMGSKKNKYDLDDDDI